MILFEHFLVCIFSFNKTLCKSGRLSGSFGIEDRWPGVKYNTINKYTNQMLPMSEYLLLMHCE